MSSPIRLYLVRHWSDRRRPPAYCYSVVRAYTAKDALTQWRLRDRETFSTPPPPLRIEPIANDDPRLRGWVWKPELSFDEAPSWWEGER